MKHENGFAVAEYLLKSGACSRDMDETSWHEMRVQCSRLFHESYQQLAEPFALALAISAEIRKQRESVRKNSHDQSKSKSA